MTSLQPCTQMITFPPEWEELLIFNQSRSEYDDEAYVPELSDEWVDEATRSVRAKRRMERKEGQANQKEPEHNPPPSTDPPDPPTTNNSTDEMAVEAMDEHEVPVPEPLPPESRYVET
jgi:hypothetical protein